MRILFLLISLSIFLCSCEDNIYSNGSGKLKQKVLWIGTSIPHRCSYPEVSCENLGLKCINKSLGSSFLHYDQNLEETIAVHSGLSFTQTEEECLEKYEKAIHDEKVRNDFLFVWTDAGYEKRLLPYLKKVDYIVIDHGYNDCEKEEWLSSFVDSGKESIDWTSTDRSNYFGAFNYIYNIIKKGNPNAKVIVGGYFQNTCTIGYSIRGRYVAYANEWIAEHYNLPLLDVWNYTGIKDGFAPGSQNYIDSLNTVYGTNYKKKWTDKDGNITYFQKFCPDAVHPFSDPTGSSDSVLNTIVTELLQRAIMNDEK